MPAWLAPGVGVMPEMLLIKLISRYWHGCFCRPALDIGGKEQDFRKQFPWATKNGNSCPAHAHSAGVSGRFGRLKTGQSLAEWKTPPPLPPIQIQDGTNVVLRSGPSISLAYVPYGVVASSNFELPLNKWSLISTGTFSGDGSLNCTLTHAARGSQRFFDLELLLY